MTDGPRRPRSHFEGDTARALKHRPQTNVPEVEIDPEDTPPPREPPDPSELEGFDMLAPELQRQLITLWNTQREHDVGLVRLWEGRHATSEVAALREMLGSLSRELGRLHDMPALLAKQTAQMTELVAWKNERAKLDLKLEYAIEGFDKQLDAIEKDDIKRDGAIATVQRDLTTYAATSAKGFEEAQKAIADLSARVRSLEEDRIKYKAKAATVATIASMLVALVAWLIGRFAK